MVPPLRFLLAAGALTVLVVGGGLLALGGSGSGSGDAGGDEPAFATTPLGDYDTAGAVVARAPFCDAIDDRQVEAVLGSVPDAFEWRNGDEVDLSGRGRPDVVHEHGCSYAAPDVGTARAWVFAPPVDAARAGRLVTRAKKPRGCQAVTGPTFGSPTLALTCSDDGESRASFRGLFGDAWLVCEVGLADDGGGDVLDAAGRWCVGVLEAAAPTAS